jgi:hypothetical protein
MSEISPPRPYTVIVLGRQRQPRVSRLICRHIKPREPRHGRLSQYRPPTRTRT